MFTRPKLMLPFQIALAILSSPSKRSPSKRPSSNRPPEARGNARCMPRGIVMGTIHFLQHLFGPHLHPLFLFFTGFGTSAVLWPLLLLYYWLVDPVFGRRLAIAMAASLLTNRILKELFNTERPFQIDQLVSTPAAERTATGNGFPSGHPQTAATFYLAFAFRPPRRWP